MQKNGEHISTEQPQSENAELAAISITGKDRIPFLQGQLTQDVATLTPDRPQLAGWASAKGRLQCVAWLADWHDAVWLILPRELAQDIARRLKMFVLRADVQVELADARVQPARLDQLTAPADTYKTPDNNGINHCFYNDNEFSIVPADVADMGIRIQPGVASTTAEPAALAHWRLMNIRAGIPVIGATTAGEFVPQMVNLDLLAGISFTKGCYVGQEIVARTQNLGRIKRRMYAFTAAADSVPDGVLPAQPVYGREGTVGQVVDAAVTGNGIELLAVIRIDCLQQTLSLRPDGQQPLARKSLPYDIPSDIPSEIQ